jgi:hypothetical protein
MNSLVLFLLFNLSKRGHVHEVGVKPPNPYQGVNSNTGSDSKMVAMLDSV